jgi:RNA polymerase sigma-70 factor (ECF subfamily)
MSLEEERRWIERLKRRDERAFTLLVRRFQGPVYNIVLRMMGHRREDALDVSQEVFVTIFKAIQSFRGESKLSTWVYRIAVNHTRNRIKYLARRHRDQHDAIEDTPQSRHQGGEAFTSSIPRPDSQVEAERAEVFLKQAIGALEPEQREVLVLREIEGLTYEEIVDITGLRLGTVKSRLHRARQAIASAYTTWRAE